MQRDSELKKKKLNAEIEPHKQPHFRIISIKDRGQPLPRQTW